MMGYIRSRRFSNPNLSGRLVHKKSNKTQANGWASTTEKTFGEPGCEAAQHLIKDCICRIIHIFARKSGAGPASPLVLPIPLVFCAGESKKMFSPWYLPTRLPVFFRLTCKLPDNLAFFIGVRGHFPSRLKNLICLLIAMKSDISLLRREG